MNTYDTWKSTEPQYDIAFICEGCRTEFDCLEMTLRDNQALCPACYTRLYGLDDEH